MFMSQILFYLCVNVLIHEDKKNFCAWYTVTHCFLSSVLLLFITNYDLGLWFRFGLSVDPVLYHLACQRLSLKTQRLNF